MKFLVYRDRRKEWRWKLKAGNGLIIADSGEGYVSKAHCLKMVELIRDEVKCAAVITEESAPPA